MKRIIGRKEKISFPEWNIQEITAKVDTGAYNGAIHSMYAEEMIENGEKVLYFQILDPRHPFFKDKKLRTGRYTVKKVKNSFGHMEKRFLIKTTISIFGEEFEAGFTLSDRSEMKNAVLLGRRVLKGRFLVDVDKSYTAKAQKNK
ncbi:ATP-dependent zinc protease [Negadavirga shengliensis]|uniref:ATP-dependent zinc protease n=1 Tax=Negadavirga shengliensis TaxID=1389218 RepID=A0ABV9T2Z2_9BACT